MTETTQALRRVVVGTARDVENVCRDINAAIVASNWSDPTIFIYQNQLHWLDTSSGNGSGPMLRPLNLGLLRGVCSTMFQCVRPERAVAGTADEDNDEDEVTGPSFSTSRPIPDDVGDMVLKTPLYWVGIPHLRSMVTLPFFRRDGSLCQEHGYDPDSHVYYFKPPGFDLPRPVPDVPTVDSVLWARHWLLQELLVDFPFASEADRANTVAMMLSPFIMQMVECPLPLFVATADNPGVGKSLLMEVIGRVLTGTSVPKAPWPTNDDEFEKKIFSIFSGGSASPMVIWDNLPEGTAVDSPLLAALHTTRDYSGRTLGKSDWRSFRNDKIWAVTGNSLGTSGDMARRTVYCALAAEGPRPEDRPPESFRHPKLRQWIDANRSTLVLACLVLIRAWQATGEPLPPASVSRMGDYAPWVETVGGILEVAEIPGFLSNLRERREASDTGVAEAEALYEVIAATTQMSDDGSGTVSFTANTVANQLKNLDNEMRESMQFPAAVDKYVGNIYNPNEKGLAMALGRYFTAHEGRWQGSAPARRVKYVGTRQKVRLYRLEQRWDT